MNIRLKMAISLAMALVLPDCSGKFSKYNYTNYKKLNEPDRIIKLRSIPLVKNIKRFGDLRVIGRYLVFVDYKSERSVKIFDLKTQEVLTSLGRKGQGPSEFMQASFIVKDPGERNTFWVYDMPARRLKKFNISKILNGKKDPEAIVIFRGSSPLSLTFTSDGKILGLAYHPQKRILIYNIKGEVIGSIGKIPIKLRNRRFALQHSLGFDGRIICKEKTGEIFVATVYGSIIEKYSMSDGLTATYYGPEVFFPEYDIVSGGEEYHTTPGQKTRLGYVGIYYCKSQDKIFLLYSGLGFFSKERREKGACNTVYIMNDKGELTEKLILDRGIEKFSLSEDCSAIYGATRDGAIIKFEYNPGHTE